MPPKMAQPSQLDTSLSFTIANCREAYVVVVTLFCGTGTKSPNLKFTKFKSAAFWLKFNALKNFLTVRYVLTDQVLCDNSYV